MDFGIARSSGGPAETSAAKGGAASAAAAAAWTHAGDARRARSSAPCSTWRRSRRAGRAVDQRADIYAFGLILYDMLVGKRRSAHAQSAVAELQARLLQSPPPVRSIEPGVPPEVDRLVSRCIESDAAKRFPTTADLAAALDRLDDNGKLKPLVRRLTWRMIAAAAVVVLLLVGGAFYTATRLSAPPKKHDPVTVVIADFQNRTNDPTFDHALGQTLRRALESASFITAFDAARVRSAFGVEVPKTFDERAARQFAINQGLGVVLAGSIAPSRAGYEITLHATQAVTGKVVSDVRRRASSKDQVLETIAQLVSSARTEPRRRDVVFGADAGDEESVDHLARRGQVLRGCARCAIEGRVRAGTAALHTGREARSQIRPGLPGPGRDEQQSWPASGRREVRAPGAPIPRLHDRARTVSDPRELFRHDRRLRTVRQGIRRVDRPIPRRRARLQPARDLSGAAAQHAKAPPMHCARHWNSCRRA